MSSILQQEINKQIRDYLYSLAVCTSENLRRIDKDRFDMEKQYQISFSRFEGVPDEQIKTWKEEELEKYFQSIAFIINEFNRLSYTPPSMFQRNIEKMLDSGVENIDPRDLTGDIESNFEKMQDLLYIMSLPSHKREKSKERTVPFKKLFTDIEPKALKIFLNFYKDYFEFLANKMLRNLYGKFTRKYSIGTNPTLDKIIKENPKAKDISNFKLIEFFTEAWKQSPVSEYLAYLKPVIRNAIDHDLEHGDLDVNYTKSTIFFKSGKYKLKLSIGEFIAKYWTAISTLYNMVKQFAQMYKTSLQIESDVIKLLLNEGKEKKEKEHNTKEFLQIRPNIVSEELSLFVRLYNALIQLKDVIKSYNSVAKNIEDFMNTCLKKKKLVNIIPQMVKYILSNYPFSKPIDFGESMCNFFLTGIDYSFTSDVKMQITDYQINIKKG